MMERKQIYKCPMCGAVVEVLHNAGGTLVCCGEPMQLQSENTHDGAAEKHVPVVTVSADGGITVSVGSVPHPMEEAHFIEWVEVINGSYVNRKYLKPGDAPEVKFYVPFSSKLEVRAYCNKHGLWLAAKA